MATSDVVLAMLRGYVSKTHQVQIRLPQFAGFVKQYAENYQHKHSSLRMFLENTASMLSPVLSELAESGKCSLELDGSEIKQIVFTQYLTEKVRASYQEVEQDANVPFPNEESLRVSAPSTVTTVDIRTEFVRWLSARPPEPQMLRLSFPDNIVNMLVPTDMLQRKLLQYSVMKIRGYLSDGKNSVYVLQRLKESFALKEQVLQSTLRDIVLRPNQIVENLVTPTEFSFSFWAHLASTILKELRNKPDKLVQDHAYCQACYLIGLYNVYFKGLRQRDHEIDAALKTLDKKLLGRPFAFTISDIYNLRDEKGISLTKRVPKERLDAYLEEKTRTESKDALPELIRVRTNERKEFLIHKDVILRLTLTKISQAGVRYKDDYVTEWFENLGDFKKTGAMLHDEIFQKDLLERLMKEDPLLYALLNFGLLYLSRKDHAVDDDTSRRIDRILDVKRQSLIPIDELLDVRRKDLFTQARLKLPLWKTIPVFKHLFRLFDRILGGGKGMGRVKREENGAVKVLSDGSNYIPYGGANDSPQFGPYAVPDMDDLGGAPAGEQDSRGESAVRDGGGTKDERRAKPSRSPSAVGGGTAKQHAAAYKRAVEQLVTQIIGSNQSIDARLKELAAKWNPLIGEKANHNLVEDVNSFVRDQVRILKRSMLRKPPDLERVENLSARIAESKIFADIKRKSEFREYVKLYLVKVLGKV